MTKHVCKSCMHNPLPVSGMHYCEMAGGWIDADNTCSHWECRAKNTESMA